MIRKYHTYLFDFDYTLADSSQGIVKCYTHVLQANGFTNVDPYTIKRTIGKTLEESFAEMTGITDTTRILELKKQYVAYADEVMNLNTFLFPETREVLQTLKTQGAYIGIVSTKYRYRIQSFLEEYDCMQYVDLIVGGEDVKEHKPSPEGVFIAIKTLHCANDCLYIGDSAIDARTAQSAHIDFCGVLHGTTSRAELEAYPHVAIVHDLKALY